MPGVPLSWGGAKAHVGNPGEKRWAGRPQGRPAVLTCIRNVGFIETYFLYHQVYNCKFSSGEAVCLCGSVCAGSKIQRYSEEIRYEDISRGREGVCCDRDGSLMCAVLLLVYESVLRGDCFPGVTGDPDHDLYYGIHEACHDREGSDRRLYHHR